MKGPRVSWCLVLGVGLMIVIVGPVRSVPVGEEQRGVGLPSFFRDIKHQFGSIGQDLRKLITSLMGATQVVYWKHPIRLPPLRRTDHSHRQQVITSSSSSGSSSGHKSRPVAPTSHPTKRRSRRKKAYTGDDYDDFFSLDSFGFW